MLGGLFLGLFPPVFLTDEVEGLNPKDMLYAGALAIVCLIVPLLTLPTMTGTTIKAWSDRALDVYRLNLSEDRPRRGRVRRPDRRLLSPAGPRRGRTPAGDRRPSWARFATMESVAVGFRQGFRFLSLVVLGLGLAVAIPLSLAARDLRTRPGRAILDRPSWRPATP